MSTPARSVRDLGAGLLAVVLGVGVLLWDLADPAPGQSDGPSFSAMSITCAVAYGAAGTLLAWSGAAPVVRRVLIGIGLTHAVGAMVATYSDHGLEPGSAWPLAETAMWLGSWLWSPAYVAVPVLLPLVLPDGRPIWRWSGWLAGAAIVVTAATWALTPYSLHDFPIEGGYRNPVGVEWAAHPALEALVAGLILTAVGVALTSIVVRYRRAQGTQRDQLRWLLLGVLVTVVVGGSGFAAPGWGTELLPTLAVLPFPAAVLVALLRHRLWDVDLVLSRSLLYTLLSATVVGGYVVAVALLGGALGSSAGAPVLATALVALLVLPLHTRLQRLVNRLVHGDPDDPYTALARLGDRLEAAADPAEVAGSVLPELVVRVARLLRSPYVAVALTDGTTTSVGDPAPAVVATPLVYGGARVGDLVVAGGELPRSERRMLASLARQAAVAVHGVLLARDAQQARAATATAREEERRRMRRDLHDGLGPALAAVALQAETARDLVRADPAAAEALLDRLVPRLNDAVSDVRTLVHDLRPPTLDELGLAESVRELATRFATPARAVHVEVDELDALPAAVDLAAYRIVSESLTNAARHAGASSVRLALTRSPDLLQVRVTDDGVGVDAMAPPGLGLRSMRERAEELGGTCTVQRGDDGRGTTVLATIPLQRGAE